MSFLISADGMKDFDFLDHHFQLFGYHKGPSHGGSPAEDVDSEKRNW
jgi:hypothetical protein